MPDIHRQMLVADYAIDHGGDITLRQSIERQCAHAGPAGPWRLKFRSERYEQKNAKVGDLIHYAAEQFERRRVGPMRVLQDHQHGLLPAQRLYLRAERFHGFLPSLLCGQLKSRMTTVVR